MKRNSLKFHFWIYFSAFAILILVLLGSFQILLLNKYYEWSRNNNIEDVANKIKKSYNTSNYQMTLDMLSYSNDVCIEIVTDNQVYYSSDSISRGCMSNDHQNNNFEKYRSYFLKSYKQEIRYKLKNSRYNTTVLVYGLKLDKSKSAFVSTTLVPISSTITPFKKLFLYLSFFVLCLSFIIAYFVSKRISNPIEKLNKASKKMAKGDYDIHFETGEDIAEINELATTLNNTKEELLKTDILQRELLANVSHDLKTPLTLIKANAEMVKDLTYNNKKKRDSNLNVIIDETDRLNLLVEDILDLSKAQSKTMDLKKTKFNIDDIMKLVISRFSVLEQTEGYKFNYFCNGKYLVYADEKRIEQVLYNLISNAVNYTGDDKIINIYIKEIENKIKIEIQDTGSGINDEDLQHIWDKYYKTDKSYHRVTMGTGLGLSIVKNLLELHQFDYGVLSGDSGTTFYFVMDKFKGDKNGRKNISKSRKEIHNNRKSI